MGRSGVDPANSFFLYCIPFNHLPEPSMLSCYRVEKFKAILIYKSLGLSLWKRHSKGFNH
jgi:hypothetical protein